ncbi:hypothetical protein GW17_00031660 [Ensete ventricosum]|nr:hypothetical protein GW17_00031660 [Ensete ventricosum]
MHPLRFPNSGIRAKVFMRKIGFKLCVMRLYRVESFYVFLLYFHNKGSEEEGRPPAGAATRRGGTCWHGGLRPDRKGGSHLQRGAHKGAGCRAAWASRGRRRPARKRLPLMARSQGAAAHVAPARGATTSDQPTRGCRLRRGSGGSDGVEGEEGLGHPLEKRKILRL